MNMFDGCDLLFMMLYTLAKSAKVKYMQDIVALQYSNFGNEQVSIFSVAIYVSLVGLSDYTVTTNSDTTVNLV